MLKATRGDWAAPRPVTNAMWLRYLADVLLAKKAPGAAAGGGWAKHEARALRDFRRRAGAYECAGDAIWDELFAGAWVAADAGVTG